MRKLRSAFFILLIFQVGITCSAQNQAVNGDHEIYTPAPSTPNPNNFCFRELYAVGAPTYPNQPLNPPGIASASSSSDHLCLTPRSGKAHGGYFHVAGNKFENLEYQLCAPLIPGEDYDVSIWIRLREESGLACDRISFWFTDWGYYAVSGMVEAMPDYQTPEFDFYSQKVYQQIKFNLTAKQALDALVVGNMFNALIPNGSNTEKLPSGGANLAYYFIDDLIVRPIPRITGPVQSCTGEPVKLFLANRPACSNPPSVLWELSSIDSVYFLSGDTIVLSLNESTSIRVLLPEDTLIHEVEIIEQPTLFTLPALYYLCPGDSLLLDASFDGNAFDHLWNTGETGSGIAVNMPGIYSLTFSDGVCTYLRSTNVVLLPEWQQPEWPDSVSLCPGDQIVLSDTLLNFPFEYKASNGQSGDTLTFDQPGSYTITLTPAPCSSPWTQTLFIANQSEAPFSQDMIPNVFTPNGDGTNDQFLISELKDASVYSLTIFNRWGKKVYQSSNPNTGWDGTKDGQDLPADVYAYVTEAKVLRCGLAKMIIFRGAITLVR